MQWIPQLGFGSGINGSPAVSGTINSFATCTGTATQYSLTTALAASLGDVILIHQTQGTGAGQWEMNYVLADAGATLTLAYPLAYTYTTGAQAILVPQYTGGTLSGAVTTNAWDGSTGGIIALISNGDLTISGSFALNAKGFRAGAGSSGGSSNGGCQAYQGEGTGGAGTNFPTANNFGTANGNGGGPGHNDKTGAYGSCGGGGGGNSTYGSYGLRDGGQSEGARGEPSGNAGLTAMTFGGGGGGGGSRPTGGPTTGQNGGIGGGMSFIFAKNLTLTTASLNHNATNGGSGTGSGGGGGAGGSCLIKCVSATLGTNLITVAAGSGGIHSGDYQGDGGAGSTGRIHIDYYGSYTGSTTPTIDATRDGSLITSGGSFLTNFL